MSRYTAARPAPSCPHWLVAILVACLAGCGQPHPGGTPTSANPPVLSSPSAAAHAGSPAAPTATEPGAAGSPTVASPAPTVAEVYRRAGRALARPGLLYHATAQVEADVGVVAYTGTLEQWADAHRDAVRTESVVVRVLRQEQGFTTRPGDTVVTLVAGRARHSRTPHGEVVAGDAPTCHGAAALAAAVLGCPRWPDATTTVEAGRYGGRAALVLVTRGTGRGGDSRETGTSPGLYLDPATCLPLALEGEGEIDVGQVRPTRQRATFAHAFLPVAAVPAAHFDPAALGPGPEAFLDLQQTDPPDFRVAWLGPRFAGAGGAPPLVLARAEAPREWRGIGLQFILTYAVAGAAPAEPVVTLQEWPRGAWDAFLGKTAGTQPWDGACVARDELALPGGRATVFRGLATGPGPALPGRGPGTAAGAPPSAGPCPAVPAPGLVGHVYLGQTVVLIYPASAAAPGGAAGPYGTPAGLAALIRALEPRQP